ncbi:MAG: arylamine N-acetyltransferase [Mycobacterium sp.]|jgi:arylamine N-acetyltransferase|nr:arylamine N-acetyltransferase [Mycobacterium sp.]
MNDVLTEADLTAYLTRTGYRGALQPTLGALSALVAAHNESIPFENLDPLFGVPVDDLGAAALADKLVHRRRGGYCYEHNGLMGFVLERLGYAVDRLAGRVVWMSEPGSPLPALTHQVLSVAVPGVGGRYLVDVGFGGQTLTSPIRLAVDEVQQTRHEPYRLVRGEDGSALHAQVRGQWQALYEFTERPQSRIDLEVGSWYVSTHPSSPFVTGMTAALVTEDGRWNLRGRNLAIHRGGNTEKVRFDNAAQVVEALSRMFGIDLADVADADVVQARVAQVLDS